MQHFYDAVVKATKLPNSEEKIELLKAQSFIAVEFMAITHSRDPLELRRHFQPSNEIYKSMLPPSIKIASPPLRAVAVERIKMVAKILDGCSENFLSACLTLRTIEFDQ